MTTDKVAEASYTSTNGRVRAYYRTVPNADDEFNRAFMIGEYLSANEDRADVPLKALCKFALETFCTRIEFLDEAGNVTDTRPFTPGLLKTLTGVYAEDGWPAYLSVLIYREVMDKTAERIEAVKKTSESVSPVLTQGDSQPAAPYAPSRT